MRIKLMVALVMLCVAEAAPAETPSLPRWTRTRPLGSGAITLLATAADRSPIIANLLEDIEQTDLVVYVSDSMPGFSARPKSHMVFLSGASGARYLLIRVDPWRLSPSECIAALGHELHHALEIAAAPEVMDAAGMEQLYRRIGWESEIGRFESSGARDTGQRVWKQLTQRGKLERRARAAAKAGTPGSPLFLGSTTPAYQTARPVPES